MKRLQFIAVFLMMALALQAEPDKEPQKLDPLTAKIKKFEIKELTLPEAIVVLNDQIMAEYPDHQHLLVGFVDRKVEPIVDAELVEALGGDPAAIKPRKGSLSINRPIPIQFVVKYLCDLYSVHFSKFENTLMIYGWHRGELGDPEEK